MLRLVRTWAQSKEATGGAEGALRVLVQGALGHFMIAAIGRSATIVHDLQAKLGGRAAASVADAVLIAAAVVHDWAAEWTKEGWPVEGLPGGPIDARTALVIAERLIIGRALTEVRGRQHEGEFQDSVQQSGFEASGDPIGVLARLAGDPAQGGRREETDQPEQARPRHSTLSDWLVYLRDHDLVDIFRLIEEAAQREGALITAASGSLFIHSGQTHDHVSALTGFRSLCEIFSEPDGRGIYVPVLDMNVFGPSRGKSLAEKLFNASQLLTAMQSFALLGVPGAAPVATLPGLSAQTRNSAENLARWRAFARRCCLVVRLPAIVTPWGDLGAADLDSFVRTHVDPGFDELPPPDLYDIGFDASHVLPDTMPAGIEKANALSGDTFHVNIRIRHDKIGTGYFPSYYVVPRQDVEDFDAAETAAKPAVSARGSRAANARRAGATASPTPRQRRFVTSTAASLIESNPPDELKVRLAHLTAYWAARGRLGLCTEEERDLCLKSAANLRKIGFEVLPADIALAILPVSSLVFTKSAVRSNLPAAVTQG